MVASGYGYGIVATAALGYCGPQSLKPISEQITLLHTQLLKPGHTPSRILQNLTKVPVFSFEKQNQTKLASNFGKPKDIFCSSVFKR